MSTDERSRRFKARIDLRSGRASVHETTPGPARNPPPSAGPHDRPAPEREPSAPPQFPWMAGATSGVHVPAAAQPQDADRMGHEQPTMQSAPQPAAQPVLDQALVDAVTSSVRSSLGLPPEEPPAPLLHPAAPAPAHHPAGAFANVKPDVPPNPAGAFVRS